MKRTKATLRSRFWRAFYNSIKHCVYCGGVLQVRYVASEKTRRHVCTLCSQITYVNPKVVAGLIPVGKNGEIYLLRRAIEPGYGYWSFPAGYQEIGESVPAAACRETWEEINAVVKNPQFLGLYSYPDAGVVTVVYWGRLNGKTRPSVGHEALEVKAFSRKDIPWRGLAFRSVKDALKDFDKAFLKFDSKVDKHLP